MKMHKSFGLLAAGLLVPRLAVRFMASKAGKIPAAFEGPTIQKMLATLNHYLMYFMLVWMPATGITMGIMGGKGIPFFDLYTVPGVAKPRGDIAKPAFKYHKQVG